MTEILRMEVKSVKTGCGGCCRKCCSCAGEASGSNEGTAYSLLGERKNKERFVVLVEVVAVVVLVVVVIMVAVVVVVVVVVVMVVVVSSVRLGGEVMREVRVRACYGEGSTREGVLW